ncbi:MAG: hypothetical protein ACFCD0_17340 [Gemmataceae bacterium]
MNKFTRLPTSSVFPTIEALEERSVPALLWVSTLADSGPGSLREAITEANDKSGFNTIKFLPRMHGTIALQEELLITDSVEIQGPLFRGVTLSGGDENRVFRVDDGKSDQITVKMTNLTIADGFASDNVLNPNPDEGLESLETNVTGGGGLLNLGEIVKLKGVRFVNNKTSGGEGDGTFGLDAIGGAIANLFGGDLTVEWSEFSNNKAVSNFPLAVGNGIDQAPDGVGGAIGNAARSNVTVSDSVFRDNEATSPTGFAQGGAIGSYNGGTVVVQKSKFTENTAVGGNEIPGFGGGGSGIGGAIVITDLVLFDNMAGTPSSLEVSGSTFAHNEAIGGDGLLEATGTLSGNGIGGAIANYGGTSADISGSKFVSNRGVAGQGSQGAGTAGGAIANISGDMTIKGSSFLLNSVSGGAADPNGDGVNTGFGGAGTGGAVVNYSGAMDIRHSYFAFNWARAGDGADGLGGNGGAIAQDFGGELTVSHSTVVGNHVFGGDGIVGTDGRGGGIFNGARTFDLFTGEELGAPRLHLEYSAVVGNSAFGGEGSESDGKGVGGGVYLTEGGIAKRLASLVLFNSAEDEDNNVFGEFLI